MPSRKQREEAARAEAAAIAKAVAAAVAGHDPSARVEVVVVIEVPADAATPGYTRGVTPLTDRIR